MNEVAQINPAIDRSAWGPGPWDGEPDRVQWTDAATSLPCLARRTPCGFWCGYVAVPPGHPLHGADYDVPTADVHGGITFADRCEDDPSGFGICHVPAPGEPDDVWWFGFDCAHGYDFQPGLPRNIQILGRDARSYRTLGYVRAECAKLARQLAEVRRD